jgi:hypothetical protein
MRGSRSSAKVTILGGVVITVIIGFTGQGKSTLAAFAARRSSTRVIFDPRFQFETTSDILPDADGLFELLDDRYEIIIQPGRGADREQIFADTCRAIGDWIEDNPLEPICLLVDEALLTGLDSKQVNDDFDWILRSARETSPISVIITCHRPADVSTNIRAIANKLVLFRATLPNDLDAIEWQCGPVVADEVRKLLDKQFILWNNSRQQWRKIDNPASWFVKINQGAAIGHPG